MQCPSGGSAVEKKAFYKRAEPGLLMSAVDACRRDPEVLKYAPRFIIVCDGGSWAAADMKTGEALGIPPEGSAPAL